MLKQLWQRFWSFFFYNDAVQAPPVPIDRGFPKPTRPAPPMPSVTPPRPTRMDFVDKRIIDQEEIRRQNDDSFLAGAMLVAAMQDNSRVIYMPSPAEGLVVGNGGTFDGGGASGDWPRESEPTPTPAPSYECERTSYESPTPTPYESPTPTPCESPTPTPSPSGDW